MREILFRGKRLDNGEWVEGCLLMVTLEGKTAHLIFGDHFCFVGNDVKALSHALVDPTAVGQFTGLKDKNGKRIFEGDVIKTCYANTQKANFVEQVVFRNGRFCSQYEFSEGGKMWAPLPDGVPHLPQDKMPYMEWCEVIGNIHDSPELLGGAE